MTDTNEPKPRYQDPLVGGLFERARAAAPNATEAELLEAAVAAAEHFELRGGNLTPKNAAAVMRMKMGALLHSTPAEQRAAFDRASRHFDPRPPQREDGEDLAAFYQRVFGRSWESYL